MDLRPLDNRDMALRLIDCVYRVYGLTFHRGWLYEPERLLELNRLGHIQSFLALEDGKVIGHLAAIRPFFEIERAGAPVSGAGVREIGLSIVDPAHRGRGVQGALALTMFQAQMRAGVSHTYMKCVTHHSASQKGARNAGGTPVALFLGSIPRWVVYEHEPGRMDQAISTVTWQVTVQDCAPQAVHVPADMPFLPGLLEASGLQRATADCTGQAPAESDLEVRFLPDRHTAEVFVLQAGRDLAERLDATVRWLAGGHIQHTTVFMPADAPGVAQATPELAAAGLIPSGWIPAFFPGDRDALCYQNVGWQGLLAERVDVLGDCAAHMRAGVFAAYDAQPQARPELAVVAG